MKVNANLVKEHHWINCLWLAQQLAQAHEQLYDSETELTAALTAHGLKSQSKSVSNIQSLLRVDISGISIPTWKR